ncbi:HDIG domain-containing metalloprotein [Micromonospora sp. NPDC005254]|uniref:HDIG domain-containing metalloprotein n=1 Tax=Micromonospora sp. NPDC005254 TaxID=3364229 RepID=UPI003673C561
MSPFSRLAETTSQRHLQDALPRRWLHVKAVAAKAEGLARLVGDDAELLTTAAWLHDIGYAPDVADTGFHALDGARWLRSHGFGDRVAALVAHHSCAVYEADERGLGQALANEFPREETATSDALWYADMTTGPDGQDLTVDERLAEIRQRYGPDDVVTWFWQKAEPMLRDAVRRTQRRLSAQPM